MVLLNEKFKKMTVIEISKEQNIEKLRTMLEIEERITYLVLIKKQINKLLIIKNGVVDYDTLKKLVDNVPYYNKSLDNKENISNLMKVIILDRDKTCVLCHGTSNNESLEIHHIIPSTKSNEENLVLLCSSCHEIVHMLLKRKNYKYGIYTFQ